MQQLQGCMDPRMMQQLGGAENLMTMMKEMGKMDLVSRKTPRACCPPCAPCAPAAARRTGARWALASPAVSVGAPWAPAP